MGDDQPRQAAASSDTDYTLSIDDAAALYERAGLPRTLRSIQRYCAKGHLDARRIETAYGEKYLISPASVIRHIAYIEEVRQVTASRDEPRHVATIDHEETRDATQRRQPPTGRDEPRQDAANDAMLSRYVAHVEEENEFLRGQVRTKDEQIKELTERSRETNHLIAGFQKMFTPLLGRRGTSSDHEDDTIEDRG
ncbi:MAG TPA: hypothetical protein VME45_20480 [Stellaceae bacterium]|nr:hypothetical protein [Stellaceae bacterium]